MKRQTTLTVLLMVGSIAAAVASPEVPVDVVAAAPAERIAIAPLAPAAVRDRGETVRAQQPAPAACDADVTAPYRLAHHGSLKVDPVCKVDAT